MLLFAAPGCMSGELTLWKPTANPDAGPVERVKEVVYWKGDGHDRTRHRLDLYLPKGKKDFPVVLFVHGGAWIIGDNRASGLYSSVGEFLAGQGIGAAFCNYRLSPTVKHPEHIKDVARAFAWTKANIADYGGDPARLYLAGHSAGGHLVALLATDDQYLKGVECSLNDVRGVVAVSGVYDIPPGKIDVRVRKLGMDAVFPLRDETPPARIVADAMMLPLRLDPYELAFGSKAEVRTSASPIHHVRAKLPPFRIWYAENELPTLGPTAEDFHRKLLDQGNDSKLTCLAGRNHNSLMFLAMHPSDPLAKMLVEFVK